jgi:hypothetical protein
VSTGGPGAGPDPEAAQALLEAAVRADGAAYRHLLDGRPEEAAACLREAAEAYRASWEAAPPRSYGRLAAAVKSAALAGAPEGTARYAREQLGAGCDSPTSCYALALVALALGDDATAARAADGMREGDAPFVRAADAVAAIAARDEEAFRAAIDAIVRDFAARDAHLTGVAIADTALALVRLAAPRGLEAQVTSPLLPPLP